MAQWFVTTKKADFQEWAKRFGIDPVLARIIRNRDITEEEAQKYLFAGMEQLHSWKLLKDMDKAILILKDKIRNKNRIRVIGDYDIDGVCATHILLNGLKLCGACADAQLPHRMHDGYGLNKNLIQEAYQAGIETIITCDNGIAAKEEIDYAAELGMSVIVTDHHEPPCELPAAAAVVDPKRQDCPYPFKGICGAFVAYKLIEALWEELKREDEIPQEFLELAAFATIGDVMELKDENRILVKAGLQKMQNTSSVGLKALMEVNAVEGKKLSPYHIGFVLGPCLNATGRLDTAERALSLLQAKERKKALELAADLKAMNESRKEMTQQGVAEAKEYVEAAGLLSDKVLVVYLPDCHESLAGIIAGRLREEYGRPVFVLTKGEDCIKGSGRSIEAYHMYDEMSKCKELFLKYGGHKMAAGLSLKEENINTFRTRINEISELVEEDFIQKIHIDVPMPFSYATESFIRSLDLLEPFGVGNPKPLFAQKNIRFISGRILGKNQNVGKYTVSDESGSRYQVIYFGDLTKFNTYIEERFGAGEVRRLYESGAEKIILSVAYYPDLNYYQGMESIQYVMQYYQ